MRSILSFFLLSCLVNFALSVPLLGPYDETIQPFNLSPGNVNLEAYWKEKYEEEANRNHPSASRNTEREQDHISGNLNLSNEQETGSEKLIRGSRQHLFKNGDHYGYRQQLGYNNYIPHEYSGHFMPEPSHQRAQYQAPHPWAYHPYY